MKKIALPLFSLLFVIAGPISAFSQNDNSGGIQFTSTSSPAAATFQSALAHHDLGETVQAREALLKAVKQDPNLAIAWMYLVEHATSPKEAVSYLANAKAHLSTAGAWEKLFYDFLETYLSSNLDQRLDVAKKMVAQFPDKARSYLQLSEAYSARNDAAGTRENLQRAMAIEPSWPGSYALLVNSFLFQEPRNLQQAQVTAEKLVSMAPNSVQSHVLLGDVFRAQNNMTEAEEEYTKGIALDATSPILFYKRGHVQTFRGDFDKARADYANAGRLDQISPSSRLYFDYTYLYQGQPQKAIQALLNDAAAQDKATSDKAKATSGKYNYLYSAGLIAMHLHDAKSLQEIITRLKPVAKDMGLQIGSDEAKRTYESSVLMMSAVEKALNKDFNGAVQTAAELKTVMEPVNDPNKANDYNFTMGTINLVQNKFKEAANHFENVSKEDVYGRYCLAKAYEGMGEADKANAIYKDLADYNFNNIGYALIRHELKKTN